MWPGDTQNLWLSEASVYGIFQRMELLIPLFISDRVPHSPLKFIRTKKAKVVNVSLTETDIISQICRKVGSKVRAAEQMVGVYTPLVGNGTAVFTGKVAMNNVTHTKNGFAPAGHVHQVFFGDIGQDILEGNCPVLADNEIFVSCSPGMQGGSTFSVGKVLQTKILAPAILHNLNDPGRVDELIGI